MGEDSTTYASDDGAAQLKRLASEGTVVRHYLEPSIRAPKRFAPSNPDNNSTWLECLLRVVDVKYMVPTVGSRASERLADSLWDGKTGATGGGGPPVDSGAAAEVEVELLTGRTHQIRGQMAALGFPLVGDVQYGGAMASSSSSAENAGFASANKERLALQCCELEFLDPDFITNRKGEVRGIPSEEGRWNRFRLDRAWWTPLIEQYNEEEKEEEGAAAVATMSAEHNGNGGVPRQR